MLQIYTAKFFKYKTIAQILCNLQSLWWLLSWNLYMRVKNILSLNLNYGVIFIEMGYMSSLFSTLLRQMGLVQCRHCTFMLILCVSVKHNLVHLQSGRNFIEGLFSQKFQPWAWHWRLEIHILPQNLTHWGRETHVYVSKLNHHWFRYNGLSPARRQAIIWTNADL